MSASSSVELIVNSGPPPNPGFGDGLALMGSVAVLLFAVVVAQRRADDPQSLGHRRGVRILAASLLFVVALDIGPVALALFRPGIAMSEPMGDDGSHGAILLLALLLIWALDWLFDRLRPTRDRFWCVAAIVGFAVFLTFGVYVSAWRWELAAPAPGIPSLRFLVSAGGSGLIWWALLPPDEVNVAEAFE